MSQAARFRLDQSAEECAQGWAGNPVACNPVSGNAAVGRLLSRPAGLLLIAGDLVAVAAAIVAFALGVSALGAARGLPSLGDLDGRTILVWLLPAFAVLGWLGTRGRAGRRAPLRTLVIGGIVGAVASVLIGVLLLPASYPVVVPAMAWLAFPAAGFALRALFRQPAALVRLREGRRAAADAVARLRGRSPRFSGRSPRFNRQVVDRQVVDRQPVDPRPAVAASGEVSAAAPLFLQRRTVCATARRPVTLFLPRATADTGLPSRQAAPGRGPDGLHDAPYRRPLAQFCKAAFDVAAAMLALLFLAPLLIVVGVLVKLDGGPVLFAHTRIGRGGKRFPCLKFRSMVVDSDVVLRRLLESDPRAAQEWAATQKLRDDPRITWIGRILRKTSLDELPQLFNVLRRDMSLVGPRPIVATELTRYGQDIVYYLSARPGITGLWQVSGRSDTSYAQRVALDIAYVRDWSLWMDMAIVARTIPAVLKRKGAV